MTGPSFRMQQFLISIAGAIFIVPTSLFFGGMLSFAFGTQQSLGAWLFSLTAFWCQILGVLASFFKPRLAAVWMLLNLVLAVLVSLATELRWQHRAGILHLGWGEFFRSCPDYLKSTWFFWAAPLLVALLLLRPQPAEGRRASQVTAS